MVDVLGILDNLANAVAKRVAESTNFVGYGNAVPLEREPEFASVPFAPGMPLIPSNINPVRQDGSNRPDPRRWEYEVAQNINVSSTRLIPFATLRASADQIDIVRRCVEVLKAKMSGLDWDISLGTDAVESVVSERGVSAIRAAAIAKAEFAEEINRARRFMEVPDVQNGLIFSDWLQMALEEVLVIDALAIWPQKTVGGELRGLQILDGSTIKPIIDDRGMRPEAPMTAFQQILFGFPRSEFSAPTETFETDGEFTSDELSYIVRNRRTNTVYGNSPVERALPLADIYLRRQQWMRAEYTDGVLPELMFETDASFGGNPDLLKAYETIFNDDLAGQTEQRKRARLLPGGVRPVQFDGYAEKLSNMVFDEYLVHSICGHFGVAPSEIGFTAKGGLGGHGVQAGEAESSEVIGLIPLADFMARQISQLLYVYLGMPRELEFKFMPSDRQDIVSITQAMDTKVRGGIMTLNEARSDLGLSLLDAEVADQPILIAGANAYKITDEGAEIFNTASNVEPVNSVVDNVAAQSVSNVVDEPKKSDVVDELKTFFQYMKKSPARDFVFKTIPDKQGETLNKFMRIGDVEAAHWYAERYL